MGGEAAVARDPAGTARPVLPPPGSQEPDAVPEAPHRAGLTSTSDKQFQTRLWHQVLTSFELRRVREAVRSAPCTCSLTPDQGTWWVSADITAPVHTSGCVHTSVGLPRVGLCVAAGPPAALRAPSPFPHSGTTIRSPSAVTVPGERCAGGSSVAAYSVVHPACGCGRASLFHCPPSQDTWRVPTVPLPTTLR